MKKFGQLLLLGVWLSQAILSAQSSVSIRTAGFYHACEIFRDVYSDISDTYEVEVSTSMDLSDLWLNIDWFSERGHSIGLSAPTRIQVANISAGVKVPFELADRITLSLGLGPSLAWVDIHNASCCDIDNIEKVVLGYVFKSCISYFFDRATALEFFVDYLYQPTHFETYVDIGGLKAGVGLGMYF